MREDEPSGLREGQQPFLVLQDQVVGVNIVRIDRPGAYGGVLQPVRLLIDREITVVRLGRIDTRQVLR